ncbi:MAG TPA: exosortase/archaeosortase family protein [Phycisphaerae bacterium]|nr:exosortase/archaeosortase family protein [Phycisphaerae bacterium]HDZ44885.1 exosortase/archaeosortase family protein [Phycisphaerae bacterium]
MTLQPAMDDGGKTTQRARLSDLVAVSAIEEQGGRMPWSVWGKVAILTGMLTLINYRQFGYLWDDWQKANWSHGYLIPLFSMYLIYSRFREIVSVRRRVCWFGLLVVLGAAAMHIYAHSWLNNDWSRQVTMVVLAISLLLFLGGWQIFKITWLPILFLVFAMPIPESVYSRISLPLQNLAATGSAAILTLVGVEIVVEKSMLMVTTIRGALEPLRVEEACSGIRLLLAFMALSVAMAYLTDRPVWQRVVLVGLGVPVAIACNVLRVTITAAMFVVDKRELGQDFMHEFTGMLMLVPAALSLWAVAWLMNRLFIEEEVAEAAQAV